MDNQEKKKFWNKPRKESLINSIIIFPFVLGIGVVIIPFLKVWKMEGFKLLKYFDFLWLFIKENPVFITLLCVILTAIFWTITFIIILIKKELGKVYIKEVDSTEYGAAKWIVNELKEKGKIESFNELYPNHSLINSEQPGWATRFIKNKNELVFNIRDNTHAVCLGATNSGKSQKIVMPSAIYNANLAFEKQPCMVFTDPKGELYQNLSKPLQEKGYEVLTLNLRDAKLSSSWNPLAIAFKYYFDSVTLHEQIKRVNFNNLEEIKEKLKDIKCYDHEESFCYECLNSLEEKGQIAIFEKMWFRKVSKAELLCETMKRELKSFAIEEINDLVLTIWPLKGSDNDHFSTMAGSITKCLMLGMLEILDKDPNELTLEMFNLPTIGILVADRQKMKQWHNSLSLKSMARIVGSNALKTGDKELGSILSTLDRGLQIYQDIGIQTIVCKNDINLFTFTDKPKALFLIVPDEKTNRHILASLFVSQLYKANVLVANSQSNKRLPRDIQFYLDEFGNMPMIPNFQGFVTVARSRGMFFLLILQDFLQLDQKYGKENGGIIRSNCNLNIYIQTNDTQTAEMYSKMLGDQTVEVISYTTSRDPKTKKIIKNPPQTRLEGMPLIKAGNLMKLKNPYGIIFSSKENPGLVYMESAWKFAKEFNLGKERKEKEINTVDFLNDYFFNLFSYVPGKNNIDVDILVKQETEREISQSKEKVELPNITSLLAKAPSERTPEEREIVAKYRNIQTKINKEENKNLINKNKQDLK
ncbi:type IV secretory system conjugative DNA transfer family protein [Spiroplasma chrysopicola]|uniref:Type IV secretion system protein VirD4 n=1 Tax=Spiroplasma chrysopicola DF-1 TaxID=1276227 RepID=R4U3S5_9MOLU|nr:type IV secretory system conjugative DNA transfer family protein [Spiroplasma chrysopicola]AGM25143.1 type IV secretion system protein VirD4 [Spiroplasma chrysopicola DF-1]